MTQGLHSIRAELYQPSRGTTPEQTAAILIPKALSAYGEQVAELLLLGEALERHFLEISRIEKQLQENGCTAPRPDLSAPLRAAWSQWKGAT